MTPQHHALRRLASALALVALAAGLAVSAAAARTEPLTDLRSPDTRDAAVATRTSAPVSPAVLRRWKDVNAYYGIGSTYRGIGSPYYGGGPVDLGTPSPTASSHGSFRWGDFGIGIAAALGALCLILLAGAASRRNRGRHGPIATA